jgi:sec-independent protein translocase protein TatA
MFGIGTTELVLILVVGMLLFGVKRLPELGSSLGEGIKNFKQSFNEDPKSTKKKSKK